MYGLKLLYYHHDRSMEWKGVGLVNNLNDQREDKSTLKTILAAELFSKLTDQQKDTIIEQIKALLLHE